MVQTITLPVLHSKRKTIIVPLAAIIAGISIVMLILFIILIMRETRPRDNVMTGDEDDDILGDYVFDTAARRQRNIVIQKANEIISVVEESALAANPQLGLMAAQDGLLGQGSIAGNIRGMLQSVLPSVFMPTTDTGIQIGNGAMVTLDQVASLLAAALSDNVLGALTGPRAPVPLSDNEIRGLILQIIRDNERVFRVIRKIQTRYVSTDRMCAKYLRFLIEYHSCEINVYNAFIRRGIVRPEQIRDTYHVTMEQASNIGRRLIYMVEGGRFKLNCFKTIDADNTAILVDYLKKNATAVRLANEWSRMVARNYVP